MGAGTRGLGRIVGSIVSACAGALLLAAPAEAQSILSPPDQSITEGGNPSRTGEVNETTVFGPLSQRWSTYPGGDINGVLVVDGLVLVGVREDGVQTKVLALDANTGTPRWERRVDGPNTSIGIAAGDGIVVAEAKKFDSLKLTAMSVADGTELWSQSIEDVRASSGTPVVTGGVVYIYYENDDSEGRFRAFTTAAGSPAAVPPPLLTPSFEIEPGRFNPVLGPGAAYVADDCGGAAINTGNGLRIWETTPDSPCRTSDDAPILAGNSLLGPEGAIYDAATGVRQPDVGIPSTLAAFNRIYSAPEGSRSVQAVPTAAGVNGWTAQVPNSVIGRPVVSSRALFVGNGTQGVASIGPTTGAELWSQEEVIERGGSVGGELVLGADHLYATGGRVTALEPLFRVTPRGIDALASGFDYFAGSRVTVAAGIGEGLWAEGADIKVGRDEAPYGKSKNLPVQTFEDGTIALGTRVKRNTKFKFSAGGESTQFEIRAYVKVRITKVRRTSRTRGVIGVRVTKGSPKALAGLRAYGYFGDRSKGTLKRLGVGKLRAAKGAAAASIPFKLLRRANSKDFVYACIDGLAKRGYGRESKTDKRCGDRKFPIPKQQRAAPDRTAGRAMPRSVADAPPADDPRTGDRAPAVGAAR